MKIFDAIIVGSGPAGSITGYFLAKAGLDVLLIEKSHFLRRKVCGSSSSPLTWALTPVLILAHCSIL